MALDSNLILNPFLCIGQVEGADYEELVCLHDSVYDQAVAWFTSLKDNMKAQILNHFGSMPGKESEPQVNITPHVCIYDMFPVRNTGIEICGRMERLAFVLFYFYYFGVA